MATNRTNDLNAWICQKQIKSLEASFEALENSYKNEQLRIIKSNNPVVVVYSTKMRVTEVQVTKHKFPTDVIKHFIKGKI